MPTALEIHVNCSERDLHSFFFLSKVPSEILFYSKMKMIIFLVLKKNMLIVKSSSWKGRKEGRKGKGRRKEGRNDGWTGEGEGREGRKEKEVQSKIYSKSHDPGYKLTFLGESF